MMKTIGIVLVILVVAGIMQGVTVETENLRSFLYGEAPDCTYDNWLSHIAEGIARPTYNLYSPWELQTDGFGGYHIPGAMELLEWEAVYVAYLSGDLEEAEALIDTFNFPYEVVDFTDLESGRNFKILRETVDYQYFDDNGTPEVYDDENGAFDWGWGLYIYNSEAEYPVILSAPHPNDDFISIPIALDCLLEWDAMFLYISGAGREVEWTEVGSYTNGKSLSDPTRNDDHPIIKACRLATDLIRENYRHEFSAQIHSYDWNRHGNRANCQLSVVQNNPNLPIRDLSPLHYDLVNQGDYLMIAAGEYGVHSDCYINDYYAVYYSQYPFYFVNEDTTMAVNNDIDLEGVGGAFLDFATEDWNNYDVFDPFFHMEMDELPNQFSQNTTRYREFYGYNDETHLWDTEIRYEKTRGWYGRWITDLGLIIPDVLELDDGLEPVAVDSVWFDNVDDSSMEVHWQPQPGYDFYSYRVYIDTEPVNPEVSPGYDRDTDQILASPLAEELQVDGLGLNTGYYIQIASLDYNENISYSGEYMVYTAPAVISDLEELGEDGYCQLFWQAEQQSGNQGFNVYRRYGASAWELHSSWEADPSLVSDGANGQDFVYIDEAVTNSLIYRYKLSAVNTSGTEYFFDDEVLVNPRPIYDLIFSNIAVADTVSFSWNYYATDSFDDHYDILTGPYLGEELWVRYYHPDWSQVWLKRDIRWYYNLLSTWKTWSVEVRSQLEEGDILEIILEGDFPTTYGIYLENIITGEMYNLNDEEVDELVLSQFGAASLLLHVGAVIPQIEIIEKPNLIYQAGDEIVTSYELLFPQLIGFISLSLDNGDQEIVIVDSLVEFPDSLEWIAPAGVTIHAANQKLRYENVNGEETTVTSGYRIGIVPEEFSYDLTAGWHNTANVWIAISPEVEEIFGAEAELYEWVGTEYSPVDILEFGKGYWLELPEDRQYSSDGDILNGTMSIPLQPGWNLLPNPYPAPLEIEGMQFSYFAFNFTFRQMVEMSSISRQVYAYRDSIFQPVNEIAAGESFYLYNLRDSTFVISAEYKPYGNASILPEIIPVWQIEVMLSQGVDNSQVVMGSAGSSSDEYDVIYDFPALPAKPEGLGCQIFLPVLDVNYPITRFHTLFAESFGEGEEKEFDILAKGVPDNDLVLSFNLSQLSLDYFAWLEVESVIYDLDLGTEFSFEPDETGSRSGIVHIMYPRVWDYGNVDKLDGVEALDAAIVLQFSVGIDPVYFAPLPWQEWRLITANVDGGQEVDSYDAALILQYCINIIEEFPVEQRNICEAPEGNVQLILCDNILKVTAKEGVYSLNLELPAIVEDVKSGGDGLLWADNSNDKYRLAIASAREIAAGTELAELKLKRGLKQDEITISVNGRTTECELESDEIPLITELYPVYPNPLVLGKNRAQEMKITFALAEPDLVKINIYNIKGQKVKSLTFQEYSAGSHEICWQIDNTRGKMISSGVYFLSMESNGYSSQRKFIILK